MPAQCNSVWLLMHVDTILDRNQAFLWPLLECYILKVYNITNFFV